MKRSLSRDRGADHEGIGVTQAHASVELVERHGEADPGVEPAAEVAAQRNGWAHASDPGGLQRVHGMEEVLPALRPVFVGVSGRVGADVALAGRDLRRALVEGAQGLVVVGRFVPEQLAELVDPIAPFDQELPEVVPALVSEVAEERCDSAG